MRGYGLTVMIFKWQGLPARSCYISVQFIVNSYLYINWSPTSSFYSIRSISFLDYKRPARSTSMHRLFGWLHIIRLTVRFRDFVSIHRIRPCWANLNRDHRYCWEFMRSFISVVVVKVIRVVIVWFSFWPFAENMR